MMPKPQRAERLEKRLDRARATKDLDLGLEGPRRSRVDLFQRALALGFDAFTFRLKAQTRDMEQADTVRVNVALPIAPAPGKRSRSI